MHVVARTTADPLALVPTARAVVRDLDPQLATFGAAGGLTPG
jgi:hypothetical protein